MKNQKNKTVWARTPGSYWSTFFTLPEPEPILVKEPVNKSKPTPCSTYRHE